MLQAGRFESRLGHWKFPIYLILLATQLPWGDWDSNRYEHQKIFLRSRMRQGRKAHNLTAIYVPTA
jgi:hypothetical protein